MAKGMRISRVSLSAALFFFLLDSNMAERSTRQLKLWSMQCTTMRKFLVLRYSLLISIKYICTIRREPPFSLSCCLQILLKHTSEKRVAYSSLRHLFFFFFFFHSFIIPFRHYCPTSCFPRPPSDPMRAPVYRFSATLDEF